MSGIEVLNTISLTQPSKWAYITTVIFYIICTVILAMIISNSKDFKHEEKYTKWVCSSIASAFCSIFLTLFYLAIITTSWTEDSGEYQYQAIIDESVSMVDFNNTYTIIRQDGKIYTIEEK